LSAQVDDENKTTYTADNVIYDEASAVATVNGSTATCTVKLPYYWYLSNASTDTVSLTYTLEILGTTAANYNVNYGESLIRYTTQYVPGAGSIPIPQNGVDTVFSVKGII